MSIAYALIHAAIQDAVANGRYGTNEYVHATAKLLESQLQEMQQPAPVSATEPKVRKSGRKDPMVLCKSCQHMIDNDEWHDCPELNKKLVKTLEQENKALRARLAEAERVTEWTSAQVEAVAMTLYAIESRKDGVKPDWYGIPEWGRKNARLDARSILTALTAARGGG